MENERVLNLKCRVLQLERERNKFAEKIFNYETALLKIATSECKSDEIAEKALLENQ